MRLKFSIQLFFNFSISFLRSKFCIKAIFTKRIAVVFLKMSGVVRRPVCGTVSSMLSGLKTRSLGLNTLVTMQLICAFVFAYGKNRFSHDVSPGWFIHHYIDSSSRYIEYFII